jgi:arsenite methyltransferase
MKKYYDDLPVWSAPFGLTLLDTVRMKKNISILDIGSGSGFPMIELAERFGKTCRVFGLDPSGTATTMVNRKIRSFSLTNAEIIKASAERIPFGDCTFGLIVSNNGLNNVADEKKVLDECSRVAVPGCQMVLTMNLPHTMIEFYDIFGQVFRELGMTAEIAKLDEHILEKRKPVEYWKERILEAGFSITSVNVDGFKMHYSDGDSFLEHSLIRNFFRPAWESVPPREKADEIMETVRRKLNKKADEEGELAISIPYVCFDCSRNS